MNFSTTNNGNLNAKAENPDICPFCHVANIPTSIFDYYDDSQLRLFSLWNCNNNRCKKVFVTTHRHFHNSEFVLESYLTGSLKGPKWPQPILNLKNGQTVKTENELETKFIKTYQQSLEAEANGYDEIAGMGFRKAIEYLVKDWAIQLHPEKKGAILEQWLAAVIKDNFSGELKDILERATWLGNDQTHYNKVFEEFNISHLKELIDLIVVELDRDFKKRHYLENIQNPKMKKDQVENSKPPTLSE